MKQKGRLQQSIYNLLSGFGFRFLNIISSFFIRTVFIKCLSTDYLGINGLYSNILSMLSLTELGFSTAIVYSMYRPLAEKDYNKLGQLVTLYKTVYRIVGTVILTLGLILVPFLDYLIKDTPDIKGLTFYYILFLFNSVLSYWCFAYLNSILQADQKSYIFTTYQSIFNIVKTILQIVFLLIFHNYTIFLLTQIGCTIAQNIAVARHVQEHYSEALHKPRSLLPKAERSKIFRDVRALMMQKIAFVTLNATDNIIISSIIGVRWVGLLSNYMILVDSITGILCQVTSAVSASLGNYFVKEDAKRGYDIFCNIEFLNFWLYGFSMIALMSLMSPFITIWLGTEYTLGKWVAIALAIRFFVEGYMNTLSVFRSTLGLFAYGQILPLVATVINIILSIGLGYVWGIAGVLIATPISRLAVQAWYNPWLIHNRGFHKSVIPFYKRYLLRVLLLGAAAMVTMVCTQFIFKSGINLFSFILAAITVCLIPNLIFLVFFSRSKEFSYFIDLIYTKFIQKQVHNN